MADAEVQDQDTSTKPVPRHRRPAEVPGGLPGPASRVLTHQALLFIADLERRFGPQRRLLLENRKLAQMRYDDGELPDFPSKRTISASRSGKSRLSRRFCRIAASRSPDRLIAR